MEDKTEIQVKLDELDRRLTILEEGKEDLLKIEGLKERIIYIEGEIRALQKEILELKREILKAREESMTLHEKVLENLINDQG